MDPHKINTVVFAGGGIRGIAYLGALLAFQDLYTFDWSPENKNLTTFAGTSVGSLIALMFVCGFTLTEMHDFVKQVPTETLFHDFDLTKANFLGLQDSSLLYNLVHSVLKIKGLSTSITFPELFAKTQRKLVVAVTDLSCVGIQYLSHENFDGPVDCVLVGSMSLPLIFKPVEYMSSVWVDGGLCDLFPIHLFDPETTLGFQVQYQVDASLSLSNVFGYFSRLVNTVALTQERVLQEMCDRDKQHIVRVDVGSIYAMQALTADEVHAMIFKAYRDVMTRASVEVNPLRELSTEAQDKYVLPAYVSKNFQKLP